MVKHRLLAAEPAFPTAADDMQVQVMGITAEAVPEEATGASQ